MKEKNKRNGFAYPFEEGNDYWTIEDGEVIWSCWDDVSEEMHDKNPNKEYFITKESAINHLKELEMDIKKIEKASKSLKKYNEKYSFIYHENSLREGQVWFQNQETILENMWVIFVKIVETMSEDEFDCIESINDLCMEYNQVRNEAEYFYN
tara:strand:+ start:39 stop:494 length:456 start_codon:yes stop_codon:yes gene_type:complete